MKNIFKNEKGAIILMFIVFLPLMMAFMGLAIDFGYIYVTKTKLQNTADAAALAGAPKLSNISEPRVGAYVKGFLEKNEFEAKGDGQQAVLSTDNNWNMVYQKVITNADNTTTIQQVALPTNATRLKVNILKKINLIFLPIISKELSTMELTATATAEGKGGEESDEYQFITFDTLHLGYNATDSAGNVHIPSFPASLKNKVETFFNKDYDEDNPKSVPVYKDYDGLLEQNLYAANLSFLSGSTLRVNGKLYTQTINKKWIDKNYLKFPDDNYQAYYIEVADKNSNVSEDDIRETAQKIYTLGKEVLRDYPKSKNNAIWIDVDEYPKFLSGMADYSFKPILAKYPSNYVVGLDIVVPVIFYSKSNAEFTISGFDVSFYSFTKPIVVCGGILELAGSQRPTDAGPDFGNSKRNDKSTFSDIYCFADKKIDYTEGAQMPTSANVNAKRGIFRTVTGGIAPKNFTGYIYADNGVLIKAAKDYRRHEFHRTIVSVGPIALLADGQGLYPRETAHQFDSIYTKRKISLVE